MTTIKQFSGKKFSLDSRERNQKSTMKTSHQRERSDKTHSILISGNTDYYTTKQVF
jgi:hypothetical protein